MRPAADGLCRSSPFHILTDVPITSPFDSVRGMLYVFLGAHLAGPIPGRKLTGLTACHASQLDSGVRLAPRARCVSCATPAGAQQSVHRLSCSSQRQHSNRILNGTPDTLGRIADNRLLMTVHPLSRSRCRPQAGTRVRAGAREYELQGSLGDGAVGLVRKAKDLSANRQVAVKFLAPDPKYIDPAVFEDVADRFRREGLRGIRLRHEHLLQII